MTYWEELDSAEFSSLVSDYARAAAFRAETLDFARKCLMLDGKEGVLSPPSNAIIESFQPIGEAISKSCTPGTENFKATEDVRSRRHVRSNQYFLRRIEVLR